MKVLFVLPNIAVGGVERVRLTLIEYLSARGIECRLALRECRGELLERARSLAPVDELAPEGIHQFVPSLARLIRHEQPTHIVTAFPDIGLLTWLALRLARGRAKWIHSVHDAQSIVATKPGTLGHLRHRVEVRMAGFVFRHAHAVITVSDGIHQDVLRMHAVAPSRVFTLYNAAVPDDELVPRRVSTRRGACRIVAVGRLSPQKGFDVLIKAMARVPGAWSLEIWGDGAQRSTLAELIARLDLRDRVHLRGYTPEPFSAMRDADLFVLSSRHEGLPGVLIEAIACGCQIVASDCLHGPREILQDGKLGELVRVDDVAALADAVTRAVEGTSHVDPALLLERARDFTRSTCCARWEDLLRRMSN